MTDQANEKLGQLLVREGRLRESSLERALEAQRLVGGRLGTNLLELGLIGEGALLEALGRQRSTCTAGRAELARITPAVLRSVPEKLAKRYRLVPYEVRGKTLFIASCDPGDLLWEDEITFLTSFMVRTCIALELHVMLALRQYYRVPVDRRFLALARRLRSGAAAKTPAAAPGPGKGTYLPASTSTPTPTPTSPSTPTSASRVSGAAAKSSASRAPAETRRPAETAEKSEPRATAPDVEFIELDDDDLALLRSGEEAASGQAPAETSTSAESPPPAEDASFDGVADGAVAEAAAEADTEADTDSDADTFEISADDDAETLLAKAALALQEADIRDEIGDVLLATGGAFFARRLLLIARRGRIVGWRGAGSGLDDAADEERIRALDLDEKAPSIFAGLRDAESFWLGPLPPLPANRRLVEALGAPAPRDCLALPIVLRSKVVAHLYADNLDRGVGGAPLADMKRLAAKAGLAFEVYILKNKIRML